MKEVKKEVDPKIKLTNVKVIFASFVDEGFGRSITIDATDKKIQDAISEWVSGNVIGKGTDKDKGVAKFKTYKPEKGSETVQFSFKMNDATKISGADGLGKDHVGYGAVISLIANAFPFDNKFGKGVGQSLSAVYVLKGKKSAGDDDISELALEAAGNIEAFEEGAEGVSKTDKPPF
jgi:hypothetical protein